MANEYVLAIRDEQNRHLKEEGFLKAKAAMLRAAEEVERYGYIIEIKMSRNPTQH